VGQSVLQRLGFDNVLNMRGGMIGWARSGLPTKRGK
jgi:rhodanese-related sulfurtransferase